MKAASLFGGYAKANPKYVTLTSNVTHSLNVVIKGFVKSGMRVVTTSMEHNSVVRPLREAAAERRRGRGDSGEPARLRRPEEIFRSGARTHTDLAVVSHCSNVCGSVQPDRGNRGNLREARHSARRRLRADGRRTSVKRLGARPRGALLHGPQGALRPAGNGRRRLEARVRGCSAALFMVGGTGSLSHEETQPDVMPDKFEAGTIEPPRLRGAGRGARLDREDGHRGDTRTRGKARRAARRGAALDKGAAAARLERAAKLRAFRSTPSTSTARTTASLQTT